MKIPIITESFRDIPATPPITAGFPAGAMIPFGAVEQASGNILNVLQTLKKQDAVNKISNNIADFEKVLSTEYLDYINTKGEASYNGVERLLEFSNKYKDTLQKSNQPKEVINESLKNIDKIVTQRIYDYASHEQRQRAFVSELTRKNLEDTLLTNSFYGIGNVDENIDKYRELLNAHAETNQLSKDEVSLRITEFTKKVSERYLAGLITRAPDQAIELIESGAFNKYLDTADVQRYSHSAKTAKIEQQRIIEAEQKQRLAELQRDANKELADTFLDGNPKVIKETLGKYRDILDDKDYTRWSEKYKNFVDNYDKTVLSGAQNTELAELQIRALRGESIETLKEDVLNAVINRKVSYEDGKRIIQDAESYRINPINRDKIQEVKQSIDALHREGIFGKGSEGETERLRILNNFLEYMRTNPGANPIDYANTVLAPMVTRKYLFFKRKREPTIEEIKEREKRFMPTEKVLTAEEYLKKWGITK